MDRSKSRVNIVYEYEVWHTYLLMQMRPCDVVAGRGFLHPEKKIRLLEKTDIIENGAL